MYSQELLDHFKQPRNVGELPPPAITIESSNPLCGDTLRLSVEWAEGRIGRVAYKARGCTAAVAAGSALTGLLTGMTADQAAAISTETVARALGGLPPTSGHVAALCVAAVKKLLRASGNTVK